ncbi:MAG: DNA gyrase subunit A [Elusimicrobia bacterium GWC2_51_8]|nr:MAG: DNA gyrase subunit A [Elusimicrobia bacterium GWA2_51_34]OGR60074.1 MAG: DNA gyrase subunit A [Elusimicrobia bacterium GWC2_51_8]OGR85135.1 MAG: DNA gyrase subunit A [Elusimicrobia bacterium GWF2_52_66]HAF94526.1 DNA gyrase subunit A [Elusimicrobiota bacterium]HCE97908.1 DNA gyrase subunit A [Elusimicrobiota bacterium]
MTEPKDTTPKNPENLFVNIVDRDISEEMKSSYIEYSMSVIVGRALPDVRDGLKPVHRRVLYTMEDMGLQHNKPFKKSARIVGDVMGKYHPHGDSAIYDTLVRMAQDFSLRYILVDGQGNFGSVDGDPAAAMRYTEARLSGIAGELLADIEKGTVKFTPNYDGSLTEPSVLPAKLPNLLVNGSSGIAVGMATNIPTHNLSEVCDATMAVIENPDIGTKDLMKIIKGPDFPTGGIIRGRAGIRDYFETGRGSIQTQARAEIEELKGNREAIIVTEIPYQVNKANLIESIAELVKEKKIPDISDIRDESDRRGMRIYIEIKRDGNAQVVLNQLYKHTQMHTSFGVIMLAIVDGRPRVLPLKEVIRHYIRHRQLMVVNRTKFDLNKALRRAHILEGYLIAMRNIDAVVAIIKKAKDALDAKQKLMSQFSLSDIQAQAILDMRLHQLTRLEVGAIEEEHKALMKLIGELRAILADPQKVLQIIIAELKELKEKYGDKRKTDITGEAAELDIEDLIPEEKVVITLSHGGYIKRIPADTYKVQGRGGKGIIGSEVREEDFIEKLFVTSSHATILMFTTRGKVYALKGYEIPEGNRTSRGKAIVNLLQIKDEKVTSVLAVESFEEARGKESYIVMCTRQGNIKKTPIEDFANIRNSGIIAIGLEDGDILTSVGHTDGKYEIIIGTREGMSIRFNESDVRSMGRNAMGVRGIRLDKEDIVVGMEVAEPKTKKTLLTVCANGYGKRTKLDEYRNQHRGGSGVITIKANDRNGAGIGIYLVEDDDHLMLMTEKGKIIRMSCKDIRAISRNTQGVRLVRLEEGDKIASVEPVIDDGAPEAPAEGKK